MIQSANHFGMGGRSGERLELKIDSDPANLRQVRKSIEEFAAQRRPPARSVR